MLDPCWTPIALGLPPGSPPLPPTPVRQGRRLGRHATITFGYQPKASGKDTGRVCRRPDVTRPPMPPTPNRRDSKVGCACATIRRSDKLLARGARKVTTWITGFWEPSGHSGVAFRSSADAQIAQLGFVERCMDTKFGACLVPNSALQWCCDRMEKRWMERKQRIQKLHDIIFFVMAAVGGQKP